MHWYQFDSHLHLFPGVLHCLSTMCKAHSFCFFFPSFVRERSVVPTSSTVRTHVSLHRQTGALGLTVSYQNFLNTQASFQNFICIYQCHSKSLSIIHCFCPVSVVSWSGEVPQRQIFKIILTAKESDSSYHKCRIPSTNRRVVSPFHHY